MGKWIYNLKEDIQQMILIKLGSDHAVFDLYKLLLWKLFIKLIFLKCMLTNMFYNQPPDSVAIVSENLN